MKKRGGGARWEGFLFVSIIAIFIGITSGTLCGGESYFSIIKRNVRGSHSELGLPVVAQQFSERQEDRFTPKPSKHVKELQLIG